MMPPVVDCTVASTVRPRASSSGEMEAARAGRHAHEPVADPLAAVDGQPRSRERPGVGEGAPRVPGRAHADATLGPVRPGHGDDLALAADRHGRHADAVRVLRREERLATREVTATVPAHAHEQRVTVGPARTPRHGDDAGPGGESEVGNGVTERRRGGEQREWATPARAGVRRALIENAVIGRALPEHGIDEVQLPAVRGELVQRIESGATRVRDALQWRPARAKGGRRPERSQQRECGEQGQQRCHHHDRRQGRAGDPGSTLHRDSLPVA
jgi:hypothetical protein